MISSIIFVDLEKYIYLDKEDHKIVASDQREIRIVQHYLELKDLQD